MASGIEFDEDQINYGARPKFVPPTGSGGYSGGSRTGNEPKMVQWLMKHGMAASPHTAQGILVVVVIINIIITYVVIKYLL